MLYLKYRLLGKGAHKRIKHLVIDEMQDYSYMQYLILAELFSCSMTILGDRFQTMDLERDLTPALLAYEGIQYRYMAPAVFTSDELEYVQEHLRILSGFYGVLRPFDGVRPYRLEMQAKLSVAGARNILMTAPPSL